MPHLVSCALLFLHFNLLVISLIVRQLFPLTRRVCHELLPYLTDTLHIYGQSYSISLIPFKNMTSPCHFADQNLEIAWLLDTLYSGQFTKILHPWSTRCPPYMPDNCLKCSLCYFGTYNMVLDIVFWSNIHHFWFRDSPRSSTIHFTLTFQVLIEMNL